MAPAGHFVGNLAKLACAIKSTKVDFDAMGRKNELFRMVDRLAGDVASRVPELRDEEKRLEALLVEAKTASERLKQVKALLAVADSSTRLQAASLTDGMDGKAPSAPEQVVFILKQAKKPLTSGEIFAAASGHWSGVAKPVLYSAINRLATKGTIKTIKTEGLGRGRYEMADVPAVAPATGAPEGGE